VTEKNSLIHKLTNRIAIGDYHSDHDAHAEIMTFLDGQSLETLLLLDAEGVVYTTAHWLCIDAVIGLYNYGTVEKYDLLSMSNPSLAGPIPRNEFTLRVAIALIPMFVEIEKLRGPHDVDDVEELAQDVAASVESMIDNMVSDERSARLCRGFYLNGRFGSRALLADDEFEWISEHAMDLLPHLKRVFHDTGFDRSLAEEVLSVDSRPLSHGVL